MSAILGESSIEFAFLFFFFLFSFFFVVNFAKTSFNRACCFDRSGRIANRNDCRCHAERVKMETP